MKKSLFCLVLLVLVSVGGLTAAHVTVKQTVEDVVLQEHTVQGNLDTARDLQLSMKARNMNFFHWNLTFTPGGEPQTTCFYPEDPTPALNPDELPMPDITLMERDSIHGTLNDLDPQELGWMDQPIQEALSRTKSGASCQEVIRMRDYQEFFPLEISLHYLPAGSDTASAPAWESLLWQDYQLDQAQGYDTAPYQVLQDFADRFRFPVPENFTLDLTLSKGEDGIFQAELEPMETVSFETCCASSNGYLYFIVLARDEQGSLLDYSHTPNGYGLYRFPLPRGSAPSSLDELEFMMLLPAPRRIYLDTDADGNLLLLTQEGRQSLLRVLDGKTGAVRQEIPLWKTAEPTPWFGYFLQDDLLMPLKEDDAFLLFQRKQGVYQLQFAGRLPDDPPFSLGCRYPTRLAYDGNRMVVLRDVYDSTGNTACMLTLSVHGPDGLQYAGYFENSLDDGQDSVYSVEHSVHFQNSGT